MPRCIVKGCPHATTNNSVSIGVTLHTFPYNYEKIKKWLQQIGQDFGNLDAFAECIMDIEKYNSFRLCSAHFTQDSYIAHGTKIYLRTDAIPTLFPVRDFPTATEENVISATCKPPQVDLQTRHFSVGQMVQTANVSTCTDPYHAMKDASTCTEPYPLLLKTVPCYTLRNSYSGNESKFAMKSVGTFQLIPQFDVSTSTDPMFGKKNAYTYANLPFSYANGPTADKVIQWPEYEQNFDGEIWKIKHDHFYVSSRPPSTNVKNQKPVEKVKPQADSYQEFESDTSTDSTSLMKKIIKEDPDYIPEDESMSDTDTSCEDDLPLDEMCPVLEHLINLLKMNKRRVQMKKMTQKILNNALEIVYLLTGEEYNVVRNNADSTKRLEPCTDKIPIKFGDVAVYFSMEEWDYIEENKELYKDVLKQELHTWNIYPDHLKPNNVTENVNTEEYNPSWSLEQQRKSLKQDELPDFHNDRMEESCESNSAPFQYKQQVRESDRLRANYDSGGNCRNTRKRISKYGEYLSKKSIWENDQQPHLVEKPYNCTECGKQFKFKYWFSLHQKILPNEKSVQCQNCGEHFFSKCTFTAHQKLHSRKKCHQCKTCGKLFALKRTLTEHRKTHNREKPHECSLCNKRLSSKYYLVVHKRLHTGEKPHACPDCDKTFSSQQALNYHLITHTGIKLKSMKRRSTRSK
ncbi:uncharacterized protein LOC128667161 [Bombina bombina]|uniref:uncharacterized protein LOC128667161 n=1 Tax=Bombina bombina TaxID=8345 RepID=UPI00235B1F98|nr:uncharacterized protein LOC128667161 [Bombina bombina]